MRIAYTWRARKRTVPTNLPREVLSSNSNVNSKVVGMNFLVYSPFKVLLALHSDAAQLRKKAWNTDEASAVK